MEALVNSEEAAESDGMIFSDGELISWRGSIAKRY
jgi:hypothetical protein